MRRGALLYAVAVVLIVCPAVWARTWTDRQGRVIEANFVRITGDKVVLLQGNKPLLVPMVELSEADQQYVREQLAIKKKDAAVDAPASQDRPLAVEASPPAAAESPAPAAPLSNPYADRVWIDAQGKKLNARFSRFENGLVYLIVNGQEQSFPLGGFCDEDRKFVQSIAPPPSDASSPEGVADPPPKFAVSRIPSMPPPFEPIGPSYIERPPLSSPMLQPSTSHPFETSQQDPPGMPTFEPMSPPDNQPDTSCSEEYVRICMNCKTRVPRNAKAGDKCKSCGVVWQYEQDAKGNVTSYSTGYLAGRIVGGAVVVLVVLSVIMKLFRG